jgi:hypothetical protein
VKENAPAMFCQLSISFTTLTPDPSPRRGGELARQWRTK